MLFSYDPILVIVSIVVSIVGSYTCFDLVIQIRKKKHKVDKKLLISAAFVIGGSIWAMHFISMLAVNLPVEIRYDVLTTLVSGLVSVLMTALALVIVSTAVDTPRRIIIAGMIMGLGISSMHYVGMSAIRCNCGMSYSEFWVFISVCIGMIASTASLWAAMKLHGLQRRLIAALVMGISISGVHYTGMFGTSFLAIDNALEFSQPILTPFSIGLGTAVSTFVILGYTLLTLMPRQIQGAEPELNPVFDSNPEVHIGTIPVQKNQKIYFVNIADIACISADGHYTAVHTSNNEAHFCNYSLSRVEGELDPKEFLRVHRSHIVNISQVESLQRQHDKGLVSMRGVDKVIPVSRSNISQLQSALGL